MVRVLATLEKAIDEYSQEGSRTSQPWRMTDWSLALVWKAHIEPVFVCIYSFYCPTRCTKWLKEGGTATSLHVTSLRIYWIPFHCSVVCVILSSPGSPFRKHHPAQLQLGSLASCPHLWPLYTRFHWDLMACFMTLCLEFSAKQWPVLASNYHTGKQWEQGGKSKPAWSQAELCLQFHGLDQVMWQLPFSFTSKHIPIYGGGSSSQRKRVLNTLELEL